MPDTMIVFGITSDLMRYKGIPALFALHEQGVLSPAFRVVGFSRKSWSKEEVVKLISMSLNQESDKVQSFSERFTIIQGEADNEASYQALITHAGFESKLIYVCVSPEFYEPIIRNLSQNNFLSNVKVLIEKPFGTDLASAEKLDSLLLTHLKEEQIFRIDHYLAKDGVQALRANPPLTSDIANIEVRLLETIGVEKRGAVYDALGALRDVGQNHLLEVMAIASGYSTRLEALRALKKLSAQEVVTHTVRGQYAGYLDIQGVSPGSTTETYFKVRATLLSPQRGIIPVMFEAGKSLHTPRKEVAVTFKNGEKRVVSLASKNNEYETLFKDALNNIHTLFINHDEIMALWSFIDRIYAEWSTQSVPLRIYKPDSDEIAES